jgi:polysaccharide biosynthesis/export protein
VKRILIGALAVALWSAAPASAQIRQDASLPSGAEAAVSSALHGVSGTGPGAAAGSPLAPVGLSGPVNAATYRVGPGDLMVAILRGPVSRSIPLEVGPEGTVTLPGQGSISVAGHTLVEAKGELLEKLRQQYRGVGIEIQLARPRTFRIYLTGEVFEPGPMLASGVPRLGDVVGQERLTGAASRRRIEVTHTDGTREIGDLQLFLDTGNDAYDPWLREGDVIYVPTATEFVYAEGALARPGRYELSPRDSLRNFLRFVGDPLPAAQIERVLMVHFKTPYVPDSTWIDLRDVYSGRGDVALSDGDRIYVYYLPQYHMQQEAQILGDVYRPGVYPISEGHTRLSRLVNAAGGFQPTADLSAIRVRRRSPAGAEKDPELDRLLRLSREQLTSTEYEILRTKLAGLREEYRVDWTRLTKDPRLDLLLRNGDSVIVERLVPSVRVDGEVRRPGILNYTQGQNVSDYVRQAGGFTDRAWRGKVRVIRSVTGQTLLARNVNTLDPGDLVWVPEKPDVTAWQQTKDILTALASVATVVIAIRSVR